MICALLAVAFAVAAAANTVITVSPKEQSTWSVPTKFSSIGIEYLNHEIYGGLYSQLIFGESFEEQSFAQAPPQYVPAPKNENGLTYSWLQSIVTTNLFIRHCDYVLWQTELYNPSEDFQFAQVNGLNGEPNSVSFVSANFPDYYLSVATAEGAEPGRLGLVKQNNTAEFNTASSFLVVPGLANYDEYTNSYQAYGQYEGYYITAVPTTPNNFTTCDWPAGSMSVILSNNPNPSFATWQVTGVAPPPADLPIEQQGFIGCGNGPSSTTTPSLVANVSMMWTGLISGEVSYNYSLINSTDAFNGNQYQRIHFVDGTGSVGLANYGLDCQLGLLLNESTKYYGYAYLRTPTATTIQISLQDSSSSAVLDQIVITTDNNTNNQWIRYNFTLIPSASTTCGAQSEMVQGATQTIYSCNGRFVINLIAAGDIVDVDLAYLSYTEINDNNIGLPVRNDIVDALVAQQMASIRIGGSMTLVPDYRWKYFRGPRDQRQPYQEDQEIKDSHIKVIGTKRTD